MKPNQKPEDESLRAVLREWKVKSSLPPGFQQQVWRRIECAQTAQTPSFWAVLTHYISRVLPRPALTASYVSVLLAIGVTAGWTHAQQETTRLKAELSQRYVQVLDPYLAPRE